MTPVRFEPAAPRSQVKHSTTEPLRSRHNAVRPVRLKLATPRSLVKHSTAATAFPTLCMQAAVSLARLHRNKGLPETQLLADEISTVKPRKYELQFFGAVFASKGYPFKNIFNF